MGAALREAKGLEGRDVKADPPPSRRIVPGLQHRGSRGEESGVSIRTQRLGVHQCAQQVPGDGVAP